MISPPRVNTTLRPCQGKILRPRSIAPWQISSHQHQPEEGGKQTIEKVDALATELNGSPNLNEATEAAASSLTTDTVSDVLDEETFFDLFAGQDEPTVQDEPADTSIHEVSEPSLIDETDLQLDQVTEIKQPEHDRGETVEIDHDPQLFGFQGICLSSAADSTGDDAVPVLESPVLESPVLKSDEIDTVTAATKTSQPESIVQHHDFDDIASLFDTLGDELDLAADTTDFVGETLVDETAPEHTLPVSAETSEAELPSPAGDVEPLSLDQHCASDDPHPARAEEDIVPASNEHLSLEPMRSEPDAPTATLFSDPEIDDAESTPLVRQDETIADQGPVECFSAMHQPIAFEEPTVEAIVVATEQTLAEFNDPNLDDIDATADDSSAIEVATIEPLSECSDTIQEVAPECETSQSTVEVSKPEDIETTAADEAAPDESNQAVTGEDDAPASTSEQTDIVTLPDADECSSRPARGRGRATTIAGLGAIAATLAIALHPPIADELLSLPWQDMLQMNEILDKLSELKRFFAFA